MTSPSDFSLMSGRPPGPFLGWNIVTNPFLTVQVFAPRSLGRAMRRQRLGHRQHHVTRPSPTIYKLPDGTLVMHPHTLAALQHSHREQGRDPK